jgi:hypothetical protein
LCQKSTIEIPDGKTHYRDCGELDSADKTENELSLNQGFRLLSAYVLCNGAKIWIITEADRSATPILLPEEYQVGNPSGI